MKVQGHGAPTESNTMKPYRDIEGDSGVSAYQSGDDWIRIQVKKDGTYEYRAARIGFSHLSTMKRLTRSGQGLAIYINTNPDAKNGYSKKWF